MPEPVRIVVIEDEIPIRRFLRAGTDVEATDWHEAGTGELGMRLVAQKNPDIVLLDLGLPDMDGQEVIRRLREWTQVPIIVLTARGQERDKLQALDGGADDYVTKPFSTVELMARVRASLRRVVRAGEPVDAVFETGGLRIDFEARQVFSNGQEVHLTQTEHRLLAHLARHAGRVITHRALLEAVWGPAYQDSTHTLRVHMAAIRQKIEPSPSRPRFIRTETGVGYRLMVSD